MHSTVKRSPKLAVLYSAPIGLLAGLMGLGGAEFRLPVLAGIFGYAPRRAVALNLAVSLITILSAFVFRSGTLTLSPLLALLPVMVAMAIGAVCSAFVGPNLAHKLPEQLLSQVILLVLAGIGIALITEAFFFQEVSGLLPAESALVLRIIVGVLFGLLIGLVSSMLGVAGGELQIPTLVFIFGASITAAGTASLLISLPTVGVAVARHASIGAFAERRDLTETVVPMAVGSIIGTVVGGALVGIIPATALKVVLGIILIVSSIRVFRRS